MAAVGLPEAAYGGLGGARRLAFGGVSTHLDDGDLVAGLDDAAPFHAQDPSGFLMGWLGSVRIGCISVVKYGADFAFLGLFIVLPAFRGKGYGKAIWVGVLNTVKVAVAGIILTTLLGVLLGVGRFSRNALVRGLQAARCQALSYFVSGHVLHTADKNDS